MAITPNWPTLTFTVPQGDLTLIGGTLYELDTEADFRQAINAIMASEEGIVFEDPIFHETESIISGVTYARKITVINGYNVTFSPDAQWSVRLAGSNNDIWDIESGILNQNQVQVIPQNSAGLISGAALLALQQTMATELHLVKQLTGGKVIVSLDDLTITVYDEDEVTVLLVLDITADGRTRTPQ